MATIVEEMQQLVVEAEKNVPPKNALAAEIQDKLRIIDANPEQDNLAKIAITKEIFEQIKKSLAETVKSMEKNPSMFSRAAEFWGELPMWQKIIGGLVLTLPTLIIGIATHIGFLLAICGVTTVTYAAGGIILDDHHKCSTSTTESLQKGILGLADLLELTINALNVIREQLAKEVAKFTQENTKLEESIHVLSAHIDSLDAQVRAASKMTEALVDTKNDIMEASNLLKEGINQEKSRLEQSHLKLERISEAYGSSQTELANKMGEVTQIKTALATEVSRARMIIDTLQSSISDLSKVAIGSEEQRQAFQRKLDVFLSDTETSFHQVVERICDAEKKLVRVQKELERANERYFELLKIQGAHIDRLEGLGAEPQGKSPRLAKALSQHGLYAGAAMLIPTENRIESSIQQQI